MKEIRYLLIMAICAIGLAACQDEDWAGIRQGVNTDKPVKVELKFGVPRSPEISVSRADNSVSGIYGIRLYIFDESGRFLNTPDDIMSEDEGGTLKMGSTTDQGQYYTATTTLYEGKQHVYAVANITRTGFVNNSTAFLNSLAEAAAEGEDNFKAAYYLLSESISGDNAFPPVTTDCIPLSGFGEITVNSSTDIQGRIDLKRWVAQLKFRINTNTYEKEDGNKITFTPSSYTIYNIPKRGYVLDGENQETIEGSDYFYNSATIDFPGASQTGDDKGYVVVDEGIYVPENIQTAKKTCENYNDRDHFEGKGNNKNWDFAPDYGMYVVIRGNCSETDSEGNALRYGEVNYTIHLGDFGENSDTDRDWSDFSVKRNCIYTYTMTVQGMDKMIAEAEKENLSEEGGYQNGAEGHIVELQSFSKAFNLDSHYEQVYMEYDLTAIANSITSGLDDTGLKEDIAENFKLSISTPLMTSVIDNMKRPYNDNTPEEDAMEGIDYKWVEFYPQSEADKVSAYPQDRTKLLTPWVVCQKLGEAVYKIYKGQSLDDIQDDIIISGTDTKVARFTIFVNEYYYEEDLDGEKIAWDVFTNQPPRTMTIVSQTFTSEDGNTTYSIPWTYITQRSIETFYNPDAAGHNNALGIETYNENGLIEGMGTSDNIGTSDDGRVATIRCINNNSTTLKDDFLDWNFEWSNVGYTNTNTSVGGNTLNVNKNNAAWACLARNRDLDGDGKVDNNELRWYLPALSQYLRIGIGSRALSATSRLYTGDKMTLSYTNDEKDYIDEDAVEDGALYYTSTTHDNYYWAVEVGAYGSFGVFGKAQIRCVRNLPSKSLVADDTKAEVERINALAGPVYGTIKTIGSGNETNYLFDFGDRLSPSLLRATDSPQSGSYLSHNENSYLTNLPEAFVVSRDYMSGTYQVENVINDTSDPCATYSEEDDKSDRGSWRVPNLNELMVMVTQAGTLGLTQSPTSGSTDVQYVTLSRTKFSNQNIRKIFYYNGRFITTALRADGKIRCVRDATQEERGL